MPVLATADAGAGTAGSAEETLTCLRVAEAWGYLGEEAVAEVLGRIDHLQAILWKLTR